MSMSKASGDQRFRGRPIAHVVSYLLLWLGGIAFLLPLLWLVSTSFKTGRELFTEGNDLLPDAPNARSISPYIEQNYYPDPQGPHARFLPVVVQAVRESRYPMPSTIDLAEAEVQIARGLLRRLEASLPPDVWNQGDAAVLSAAVRTATPAVLDDLMNNVYRRLLFGNLIIRSTDLETQILGEGTSHSERLRNDHPDVATLTDVSDRGTSCAFVSYDFNRGSEVSFEQTFETRFPTSQLQRIQLAVHGDDNWQRLQFEVEKQGKLYKSARAIYLANADWYTFAWQEPGPDDQTNRIKSWVHLKEITAGPGYSSGPNELTVRVRLLKTNQLQAWWGKLTLNYLNTAQVVPFVRYFGNSLYLITLNVTLLLLASSIVAYGVSRLTWPGRDLVFILILATMMLPEQVTMIPSFLIWKNLGFYNTMVPLWLGAAFGSSVQIFLLRQFMRGIPRDVEDAAKIDGCGVLRVYWHIMLPLVKPALVAIGLLATVAIWNDFKGPLLYLADQRLYPLSFGLYAFSVQVTDPAQTMAASIVTAAPIITLFFFAQRHFIEGVSLTGVKG